MHHSKILSAIDIGTSKITTIIGQQFEQENRLNIVAVSSVPALGFRKGQIINLEQASATLTQSVESAERMAGFQINNAYVAIAANHIESVNSKGVVAISNPNGEISHEDIVRVVDAARAITLPTGKEILHVIPRIYTVDGQEGIVDPVGMNGVRLETEAHLIIASTPAIKNIKKSLEEIGISINELLYTGLASAKAALTDTEKELGVALVDIGGSITTITIFFEGSPIFSSVIPVGANNITNDLAIGLRFSLENAEKIKLQLNKIVENKKFEDEIELSHFGVIGEEKKKLSIQTAINGIIKPRLEEIFNLILGYIQNSGSINSIPAGIVLTGGGSLTIHAKEICSKIIPLPVRIAQPPQVGGIVDEILNPAYCSSIGLLLNYIDDTRKFHNTASKKSKMSFGGLFGKIKSIIRPLFPS